MAILLLAAMGGCIKRPHAASEVAHDADEPTRSSNPLDFLGGGEAEFDRLVAPRLGVGRKAVFLAGEHAATRRVQFWIDEIHAMLNRRYPKRMAGIPKPVARIWLNLAPNGFVVPISVCATAPVRFATSGAALEDTSVVSVNFSGVLFSMKRKACRDVGEQRAVHLVEWFTRNVGSCNARLVTESSMSRMEMSGCRLAPPVSEAGLASASGYGFFSTSQVVTITSGFFAFAQREPHLVAVIAHELGHYYRSHPAMWTARFNFFYRLGEENTGRMPVPDPALEDLGAQALRASRQHRRQGEAFRPQDPAAQEILRRALSERLGYWTYEQEADDLAAEWLAYLGFPPEVLMEKIFMLLKHKTAALPPSEFEFNYDQCKALADAGWKNPDGSPATVPIGDFANPHHSLCYRAVTIVRESAAHGSPVAAEPPSLLSPREFADLKSAVAAAETEHQVVAEDTGDLPEGFVE